MVGQSKYFESLESRTMFAVVTSVADMGAGSLREAINAVNNGDPIITFNLPAPVAGTANTIALQTPLPAIQRKVLIDAYLNTTSTPNTLARGSNAVINVQIAAPVGTAASKGIGLDLLGTASEIRGLSITGFATGIRLHGVGSIIEGCFIGMAPDGIQKVANGVGIELLGSGHRVGTDVGATAPMGRNLISGNSGNGVVVRGTTHLIRGNLIGTDRAGLANKGNGADGIVIDNSGLNIVGGRKSDPDFSRNVIGFNTGNGVRITGSGATQNKVTNNFIGLAANGNDAAGNTLDGVRIENGASNNDIGAPAGNQINGSGISTERELGNIILHNTGVGVTVMDDASHGNTIRLNSIDYNGMLGIDLKRDGVTLNDEQPPVFDVDQGPNTLLNFPSFSVTPGTSNKLAEASGVVRSTAGQGFFVVDLYFSFGRDPSGHGEGRVYFGTELAKEDSNKPGEYTWKRAVPPGLTGFLSTTTTHPRTGDTSEFSGAVAIKTPFLMPPPNALGVTTLADSGIGSLRAAILQANSMPGTQEIIFNLPGNGAHTISLGSALPDITEELVISGQSQAGYLDRPLVQLDGNGGAFHAIRAIAPTQIGGLVFSNFRGDAAVKLAGVGGHVVGASYFGTDITGTFLRSNNVGILSEPGSNGNEILDNVIAGSVGRGVELRSSNNRLLRNLIGPRANGTPLGNFDDGVYIAGSGNRIGPTVFAEGNTISGNGGAGVAVASGTGNRIGINVIDTNTGLPVDLGDNGFTNNDMNDIDGGANLAQNFLQIEAAMKGNGTSVIGELQTEANKTYRVDFYSSDGSGGGGRWLGNTEVTTDVFGSATVGMLLGQVVEAGQSVSAVVTDAGGNSSEFSPATVVFDLVKPNVASTKFDLGRNVQVLDVRFSEDVGDSLDVSDFNISRVGGGAVAVDFFSYDADSETAHLYFHNPLPDGNYRLNMAANAVRDFAFNPLMGNVVADFKVFAGDANGDGKVDVADLGILASNWQKSGRVFAQGDFDRNGMVDVADLGILASRWQQSLAAASAPSFEASMGQSRGSTRVIDTLV